ncbi:hypothetical protein EOW77_0032380 [Bradyrhizobium yuanmingense]|uniref:hypothetical protein n=1 Tax=Bradyrhizobium yuanmingense TaxID=108015 RepID=UPI000FE2B8A3|nr:hypothetical protein [Bradyrhizobium yuanmingense]TGN75966.1 hypothetical protein EOW77_0032380 [Bradyrhizobium yuanmingense]
MSFVAQSPTAVNSTFTFTTGAAEANLYDGNDATPAADAGGLTASTRAAYDLGSAKQIERCRAITATSNGFSNAATFNIQYSDTSLTAGFTTVATIIVPAGTSQAAVETFPPAGTHRYWAISYASGTTGGNAWLGELTFYTQPLDVVPYTEMGKAAAFSVSAPSAAASYSYSGISALFSARLASALTTYVETGSAALFRSTFSAASTSYALTGIAAQFTSRTNADFGAFTMTGSATQTLQSWAVSAGAFLIGSVGATLSRDFINWVQRPFDSDSWATVNAQDEMWTPASTPSTSWTTE